MKLLVATGNRHKFSEISAILKSIHLVLISLKELGEVPQVVEDGATFEANAIKKAVTLARFSGLWTLADDSGLEVEALGGEPGVWSARYAGEPSNDAANNDKLLRKMRGVVDRRARFRCAIAVSDPNGAIRSVSAVCEGTLLNQIQGEGGFGYDSLFVPCGHDLTFAEISADTKNGMSHRAKALARAVQEWGGILVSEPGRWPD